MLKSKVWDLGSWAPMASRIFFSGRRMSESTPRASKLAKAVKEQNPRSATTISVCDDAIDRTGAPGSGRAAFRSHAHVNNANALTGRTVPR